MECPTAISRSSSPIVVSRSITSPSTGGSNGSHRSSSRQPVLDGMYRVTANSSTRPTSRSTTRGRTCTGRSTITGWSSKCGYPPDGTVRRASVQHPGTRHRRGVRRDHHGWGTDLRNARPSPVSSTQPPLASAPHRPRPTSAAPAPNTARRAPSLPDAAATHAGPQDVWLSTRSTRFVVADLNGFTGPPPRAVFGAEEPTPSSQGASGRPQGGLGRDRGAIHGSPPHHRYEA
jgi:hypothetical protein